MIKNIIKYSFEIYYYFIFSKVHDVLAKSFPPNISPESVNALLPATPSNLSYNEGTINLTDYKKLYNDTLDECNMLKAENRLLKKKEKKKR